MDMDLRGLETIQAQEEAEEDEEEITTTPPELKYTFSEKLDRTEGCENILIIDGDYFEIGIKGIERLYPNKQLLSDQGNIVQLLSFIESKAGIPNFDWKSFHSAEEPKVKKRKSYYCVLENNGFHFDIREFKSKKVKCPNTNCQHSKKAFVTRVQAEVDVAISMTTMNLLLSNKNKVKNVVFVIGDRDFYDLFKYLKKTEVNTYIFGFRKNLSHHFYDLFSPDNITYFEDHWDSIIGNSTEDEFPPLNAGMTNFSEHRQINFRKCHSEAFKLKPTHEKEVSETSTKKKRKSKNKKCPNAKKEEVKLHVEAMNGHVSHSSTDDSLILTNGTSKKQCGSKSKLRDSELDIFIGLGLNEDKVIELYKQKGMDLEATLEAIIDRA